MTKMADETCKDLGACNWAMLAHLLAVPGFLFGGGLLIVVGPLLVWIFRRNVDPFVERNAVHAFNFQATVTILLVAAHLIASTPLVLVGASLIHVILVLAAAPLTIWAAWRARGGYAFTYPVAIPFLR